MADIAYEVAPWPVWRDSIKGEVRWPVIDRDAAVALYRRAESLERETKRFGCPNGALSRCGVAVLGALLFRFLNYQTGQLDPSHDTIAEAIGWSVRAVRGAVKRLRLHG